MPALKAALREADVGRVYVLSKEGLPDYVQVAVSKDLLLVRLKSVAAAVHVAEQGAACLSRR